MEGSTSYSGTRSFSHVGKGLISRYLKNQPAHTSSALVLGVAFTVRMAFLSAFTKSPFFDVYFGDQLYYRTWGWRIASGEWLGRDVFEQGPLYAYLLGGFYRLLGLHDLWVIALQLLAGVATTWLVFVCGRHLFGERAGLAGGLIAALYGPRILHESLVMKTFLEPLLIMAILWASLRSLTASRRIWFAAVGALLGVLCLVREVHVLLLLPIVSWYWLANPRLARRRRLAHVGVTCSVFALTLVPSALHNVAVGREAVLVTAGGGEVFSMGFGPYATGYYSAPPFVRREPHIEHEDFRDEARLRTGRYLTRGEASRYWFREGLRFMGKEPVRTLTLAASKVAILFNDAEIPDMESYVMARREIPLLRFLPTFGWIAGLGLLGGLLCLGMGKERGLPAAFALILVLEIVLSYNYARFRMGLTPLWCLFAGHGAVWLSAAGKRPGYGLGRVSAAAATVMAVSVGAYQSLPDVDPRIHQAAELGLLAEYRQSAAFRNHALELTRLLEREPKNGHLLFEIGGAWESAGKIPEAVHFYRLALDTDPSLAEALWRLSDISYRGGSLDRALAYAREYVALRQQDPRGHMAVGVYSSRLALAGPRGRGERELLQEARLHFEAAVSLDPRDASTYYFIGKMRALEGKTDEARGYLQRSLDLKPSFAEAKHILDLLNFRSPGS